MSKFNLIFTSLDELSLGESKNQWDGKIAYWTLQVLLVNWFLRAIDLSWKLRTLPLYWQLQYNETCANNNPTCISANFCKRCQLSISIFSNRSPSNKFAVINDVVNSWLFGYVPRISPPQVHHSPSLADSGNFEDMNCTFAHTLEKELEKLRQNYDEMREKHNEKVEQLLKIIADSNDK